jgi:hypothetical protein
LICLFGGFGWGWHNWGTDWHGHGLIHGNHPYYPHSREFGNRNGFGGGRASFDHSGGALRGGSFEHTGGSEATHGGSFDHAEGMGSARGGASSACTPARPAASVTAATRELFPLAAEQASAAVSMVAVSMAAEVTDENVVPFSVKSIAGASNAARNEL